MKKTKREFRMGWQRKLILV